MVGINKHSPTRQLMKQFLLGSPNGKTLAFQFEKDGRWVIHLMHADGSERRELIDNGAWAAQPKWFSGNSDVLPIEPSTLQIQQWGKIRAP